VCVGIGLAWTLTPSIAMVAAKMVVRRELEHLMDQSPGSFGGAIAQPNTSPIEDRHYFRAC
jgi:hypothetical protein